MSVLLFNFAFMMKLATTNSVAHDSTRVITTRVIEVLADPCSHPWSLDRPTSTSCSVDDLMRLGGLTLIQRSSGFAGEVSMLGLRGGQLNSTIDGMKIHAACVDKMDPSTAYLELDNLDRMDVRSDGSDLRYGQNLGGSVNFTLKQPQFNRPLTSVVDASLESNAMARRLRLDLSGGTETMGIRAGYTMRTANDIKLGNNKALYGSGYTKHNLQVGGLWSLSPRSIVSATCIADVAQDVGYPALIMDTRKAVAFIGAITWRSTWSSTLSTSAKLYANTVNHSMDDDSRSVDQINSRSFMPGMYMPMVGTTQVWGFLAEGTLSANGGILRAVLDATTLSARATMDMIPLDKTVSTMSLINIGDAQINTVGLGATWEQELTSDLSFRLGSRVDVSTRAATDPSFRSVMSGYYPGVSINQTAAAFSVNACVSYAVCEELRVSTTVSRSERMPTHLELYGFWLYDPQANIVTIGRPDLKNESAIALDVSANARLETFTITSTAWVRQINNYIAPTSVTSTAETTITTPPTRTMGNIGSAVLAGFDVASRYSLSDWCSVQANIRGAWGQATDVKDPLPLIPPLQAGLRVILGNPIIQGEVYVSGAASQRRNSTIVLAEDTTPAWLRTDLVVSWKPLASLRIQVACTNLLDAMYHEHTSINNMPSRGRSFNVGMRVEL